jgi:hypothetical protein
LLCCREIDQRYKSTAPSTSPRSQPFILQTFNMRSVTLISLLLGSLATAAPIAQVATGAPPAAPPATPAAAPPAFDLGALLGGAGGLDLGALLGGLSAPDANADVVIAGYKSVAEKNNAIIKAAEALPATGDATTAVKDLLTKVKDLSSALKDAQTKTTGIQPVGFIGASGLGAPGSEVTSSLSKAADALVAKKDVIVKAGQKDQFLQAAKALKTDIDAWTKAINAKLPDISMQSAQQETATSLASADKIVTAFT